MKLVNFLTLLLSFSILLVAPAQARIGETVATCVKRYGSPSDIKRDAKGQVVLCWFKKGTFLVGAMFHEGKCCTIMYQSRNTDILGMAEALSDNQISLLLKANGGGKEWTSKTAFMDKSWELENGTKAFYTEPENRLMIATKEHFQREKAKREKKEKDDLEGF